MNNNKSHYNEKVLQLNKDNYEIIKEYDNIQDLKSFLNLNHKDINYIKLSCNHKINDFLGYKWIWDRDKDKLIKRIPIKLLNEKQQLYDILKGENINIFNMRYYCTLIIKDCLEKGIVDSKEIIGICFDWAKKNNIWIKLNIVDLTNKVLVEYTKLKNVERVYFTKDEILYIKNICGNKKKSRLFAIGLLAYAKVHNIDNIIDVNIRMLCEYVGIDISSNSKSSNFYNRDLRHLFNCGFIEDIEEVQKWKNNIISFNRKLKINYPLQNKKGDYVIYNDNFIDFYKNINWSKIN